MRGDDRVLDYLNRSLRSELTAINQYWLHYRIFDNWGYKDLAKKWREESIEEMHHADRLPPVSFFSKDSPTSRSSTRCGSDKRWRKFFAVISTPRLPRARSTPRRRNMHFRPRPRLQGAL